MKYSFDKLWEEFNKELLLYIQGKVRNNYDAEDVLHDVSIKIFNNISQLENHETIKSWIYKITKNTIIDYYRKKKDVLQEPESLIFLEGEKADTENMNDEISECMKHMLFDLPQIYQEVYDLHENKELKHKEIVKKLNITLSTSKVRLKRAKELFKENLINCCDFKVDNYGNVIEFKQKQECNNCKKC